MNRIKILGKKKVFAVSLLAYLLLVYVSFADTTDPNTAGVDSIWYNSSIPGFAVSPLDPNTAVTIALAASGPESVFAIQEIGGQTQLVQIVWNTGAGAWLREVIDNNNDYVDIANDVVNRDTVFAIIDEGGGLTDLYEIWWGNSGGNWGWHVSDLSVEDDNVEIYKSIAMDPRRESVWCAREGSLWSTRWNTYQGKWDVGANNWINQNTYAVLADNNYPYSNPSDANVVTPPDPAFYDQVVGTVEGGGLHVVWWAGSSWSTGEIDADVLYADITVHSPDHIIAALEEGGLEHIYWSGALGYWVRDRIVDGVKYVDVEADRENVFWAARAGGGLEQFYFNGYNWIGSEISTKEYTEISNAFTEGVTNGTDSVFGAPIVVTPVCGDALHPYPYMDFDNNCIVDLRDYAEFAIDWLTDNRP